MPPTLVLGYIIRDDADMLSLTLPKIRSFFDAVVAVDANSTDTTRDVLKAHGAVIEQREWNRDYAGARNACIALAERTHPAPSTLMMMDADEAMTARDLVTLRTVANELHTEGLGMAFSRYEFVDDLFHFNPSFYPDYQVRMFPLHQGFQYHGVIHEQLYFGQQPAIQNGKAVIVPYLPIFHYGKTKSCAKLWLKYENYRRVGAGEPLLTSVPDHIRIPPSYSHGTRLMFHGERPI